MNTYKSSHQRYSRYRQKNLKDVPHVHADEETQSFFQKIINMSVITIQEEGVEIAFATMKELSRWAVDVFKMDQRLSGIASSIDDNDVSPDTFRVIAELLEKYKTHGNAMPRRHMQALSELSVRVKSVLDDVLESNAPATKKHKGDTKIKVNVTVNSE